MKSIREIASMLVDELISRVERINFSTPDIIYYNEVLGDTSFLLAGLLDSLIKKYVKNWDRRKWFDDCLITKVANQNGKITIYGIMIFGKENTTEQWTAPFSFEIQLLKGEMDFGKFIFSFYDSIIPEIAYETFRYNREFWMERNNNWKYIIDSKNFMIND